MYLARSPLARRIALIFAGLLGLLCLTATPAHAAAPPARDSASFVVSLARSLIGAPYASIGDDPTTGFSCIGFVHYLYGQAGVDVPYSLDAAYAATPHVAAADLRPGDLVFFSNTVWPGLSHVALYVGDGYIIGADNFTTGVEMTRLSAPYWVAHYTGAARPLGATNAIVPTPIAATPHPRLAPPAVTALAIRAGQFLNGGAGAVYSGPGYAYLRIDRLAAHTGLRVVRLQDGWADVDYGGLGSDYYGWVDAAYLAACAPLAPPPHRTVSEPSRASTAPRHAARRGARTATVIAWILLLRRGPAHDQPIVARLARGTRLSVLGAQGSWLRVATSGATGWVWGSWLRSA